MTAKTVSLRGALLPYVASAHAEWLAAGDASTRWREVEGTMVFADVSGFTALAERLARRGKVGAEELTDILNAVVGELLAVAGRHGGDCLKFGGDALLLLYDGEEHARRACAAATGMLESLRPFRRMVTEAGTVRLGMSIGVDSGVCLLVLAGRGHQELIVAGEVATGALQMEARAGTGTALVSAATAAHLGLADLGRAVEGGGYELRRSLGSAPALWRGAPRRYDIEPAWALPPVLASYLTGAPQEGEHRSASVGFVQFSGTDDLLASAGPTALAEALDELVCAAEAACAEQEVTFLATDADKSAGKMILVAGVPTASPDDEDRLLNALRAIIDSRPRLPVRAGATRGRVFAVDLGSTDRRCFTVMGDAVNLAARIMARAERGQVLAADVLVHRARTPFALTPLEPFAVKGKSQPVHAVAVGPAEAPARTEPDSAADLLVGRERELAVIRDVVAAAHRGAGRMLELVGEPGIGKSTLLREARALAHGLVTFAMEGGRYSRATPYLALRRPLGAALGIPASASAGEAEACLREAVARVAPGLQPWISLLGVLVHLDLADTPEAARLDPAFRAGRLQTAAAELMEALLPATTLILVEDAHWLDAATQRPAAAPARRRRPPGVGSAVDPAARRGRVGSARRAGHHPPGGRTAPRHRCRLAGGRHAAGHARGAPALSGGAPQSSGAKRWQPAVPHRTGPCRRRRLPGQPAGERRGGGRRGRRHPPPGRPPAAAPSRGAGRQGPRGCPRGHARGAATGPAAAAAPGRTLPGTRAGRDGPLLPHPHPGRRL